MTSQWSFTTILHRLYFLLCAYEYVDDSCCQASVFFCALMNQTVIGQHSTFIRYNHHQFNSCNDNFLALQAVTKMASNTHTHTRQLTSNSRQTTSRYKISIFITFQLVVGFLSLYATYYSLSNTNINWICCALVWTVSVHYALDTVTFSHLCVYVYDYYWERRRKISFNWILLLDANEIKVHKDQMNNERNYT